MNRCRGGSFACGLCALIFTSVALAAGLSDQVGDPASPRVEQSTACGSQPGWMPCVFRPGNAEDNLRWLPVDRSLEGELDGTASDGRPYWRRNLFKRFLQDQKFLIVSWWPAESRRYGFSVPMVAALAGAVGSSDPANGFDLRWQRSIQSWTVDGRRGPAEAFTRLGDTKSAVVLLGGAYVVSRWTGSERIERATSLSAEALMNTAIYAGLLKRLTRRTRPASAGTGEFFVLRPQGGQEATSFPSGHAMGAFAVAAVFSREFRHKRWVPWVAYGTASLIALSRVGLGRHFPSDVLAGALIGDSMGRMVIRRSGGGDDPGPWNRVEPLFEPRNNGFGLTYRYAW